MNTEQQARVGVGLFILKDGRVLLGKRKGSHGAGEYGGPGGHLEYGETLEETALRELKEECGIQVKNLRLLCVSDLLTYLPKHYIDIGMTADWVSGEPKVLEPEKVEFWGWYDLEAMPKSLFGAVSAYCEAYKTGKKHFSFRDVSTEKS